MSEFQCDRDAIREALLGSLGTVYDCTRAWSAWSYGTMGPEDFTPFDQQDDRIDGVVDAIIAALPQLPERVKCDGNHGGPRCADPECWNDSPPASDPLKDNQIAALVNKVCRLAREFHNHDSLRQRISQELAPALKAAPAPVVEGDGPNLWWICEASNPSSGAVWKRQPDADDIAWVTKQTKRPHVAVRLVPQRTASPAAQTEAPADPRIRIDFKQATELLEMFNGLPAEIVLKTGDGHSGRGLYAWWDADPSAGAMYLGETDEEAAPEATPAPQQATPEPCKLCDGMGYVDGVGDACAECGGQGATPEPLEQGLREIWQECRKLKSTTDGRKHSEAHALADWIMAKVSRLRATPEPVGEPALDECPHLIWFDDQDMTPVMFAGAGARTAALQKFKDISGAWNAHLFVRVAKNSRDDQYPCATLATRPAPGVPELTGAAREEWNKVASIAAQVASDSMVPVKAHALRAVAASLAAAQAKGGAA